MSLRASLRALPVLAAVLIPACSESTGNKAGPPSKIVVVSEAMFTGTVGTELAAPIVVRVADDQDRAVEGAVVQFRILEGTASLSRSADTTDAQGRAQTTLTLGTAAGPVRVSASVTGVTTSAQITGVAVAGALAKLVVMPKPVVLKAVGDTARLIADLTDAFGNSVPSTAISWQSLDQTVATVDAAGLVTGRREAASTKIVASANGFADTVNVSVADPNASVCAAAPVSLAPGEYTVMDPSAGTCISASVTSEYVAIPFFASNVPENTTDELRVLGVGLAPFSSLSVSANAAPTLGASAGAGPQLERGFESALRQRERRQLGGRFAAARRTLAQRARSGAQFNAIPNTLVVGDIVTLNASGLQACTEPINRPGRVAAISQKAVIVSDTTNPAGGFTDADYARIAAMFDTLVVPVNEQTFGAPGDMDGNGRSVIFYTNAVNQLTPANSGSYVGGFFYARDLFPKSSCETSNEGEIFYMLVPDPNGTLGNTFPKSFVERVTVGTLAHEYQHLINASRRLANPLVQSFEVYWLNEGLSHIAEEMVFYRQAGRQPRGNIGGSAFGEPRFDQAFANYQQQNIGRLRSWMTAPESNTTYRNCGTCTSTENLATRGAAWALLRYAADRTASTDGDVWKRLVDNVNVGMTNFEQVFGINTITATKDWSIAMYADDYATSTRPEHTITSWNFRTLFPGMTSSTVASTSQSSSAGPFPLLVKPLTNEIFRAFTLKGGSAAYFPFVVSAGGEAQVTVQTSTGVAAPAAVTVTILRTK